MVTGFTGLVLAFSLVQAQGNLRNLEAQVNAEAHDLAQLDRLLVRYGDQNERCTRASPASSGASRKQHEKMARPASFAGFTSGAGHRSMLFLGRMFGVDHHEVDLSSREIVHSPRNLDGALRFELFQKRALLPNTLDR
jgi:hypothetical protein